MSSQESRNSQATGRRAVLNWPHPPEPPQPHDSGTGALLRSVGPGLLTGIANIDPSVVITATVVGAAFHFSLLWVIVLCIPFLSTVFAVSARIGYEARKGLVDLLRENYGRHLAAVCAVAIVAINMAMIIADLMAVSDGMSIILLQKRSFFVAAVAFTVWYFLIFRDYRKLTRILLWLSAPLFLYVLAALLSRPNPWSLLVGTFVPHVSRGPEYVTAMIGLFGSLLTPYVLVWQTSSRREEALIGRGRNVAADSHAGTFASTLLSYSIVVAAAMVLNLPNPVDMTTRQAAAALTPAAGYMGVWLFAVGIIGAGMVALPVLVASMCYSVAEAMGWPSGLSEHPWEAKRFYVLISAALFIASVVNFFRINPVKALYFSQVLAGMLTIPILIFILLLSNNRRVMQTLNTRAQNFWMGAVIGALVAAGTWFLSVHLL
ncbi:MAG: divalent metal cation transporter [Candidatus Korobacteraceae bacterium]